MSITLMFTDQIMQKLQMRGLANDWNVDQLAEALTRVMIPPPTPLVLPEIASNALDKVPNDRMIFEMLKRGFAVMKVPESGRPEALEEVT